MFNIWSRIAVLNMGTIKKIGAVILSIGFILAFMWLLGGNFILGVPLPFWAATLFVIGGALYLIDSKTPI